MAIDRALWLRTALLTHQAKVNSKKLRQSTKTSKRFTARMDESGNMKRDGFQDCTTNLVTSNNINIYCVGCDDIVCGGHQAPG